MSPIEPVAIADTSATPDLAPTNLAPMLCVSIHDVAPATWPDCLRLVQAVREVADIPLTWLVVPHYHFRPERSAGMEACLDVVLERGDELALHGYSHLDTEANGGGLAKRFLRSVYTRKEGEFAALAQAEAQRRLELGLAWFAERGWPTQGFVPPAWLLGKGSWNALRASRFAYTTTFSHFHCLRDADGNPIRRRVLSPSLVYAARNRGGRLLSPRVADATARMLQQSPLLRFSLHPPDARYPQLVRHMQRTLERLLAQREAVTKEECARRLVLAAKPAAANVMAAPQVIVPLPAVPTQAPVDATPMDAEPVSSADGVAAGGTEVRAADADGACPAPVVEAADADDVHARLTDGDAADTHIADARVADAEAADAHGEDVHLADAHVADEPLADAPVADAHVAEAHVADAEVADARGENAQVAAAHVADTSAADVYAPHASVSDARVASPPPANAPAVTVTVAATRAADARSAAARSADTQSADTQSADARLAAAGKAVLRTFGADQPITPKLADAISRARDKRTRLSESQRRSHAGSNAGSSAGSHAATRTDSYAGRAESAHERHPAAEMAAMQRAGNASVSGAHATPARTERVDFGNKQGIVPTFVTSTDPTSRPASARRRSRRSSAVPDRSAGRPPSR